MISFFHYSFKKMTTYICMVSVILLVTGCSYKNEPIIYKLYPGDNLPDENITKLIVNPLLSGVIYIDNMRVSEYNQINLLPGEYSIKSIKSEVERELSGAGFFVERTFMACSLKAKLSEGHTYSVKAKRGEHEDYCIVLKDSANGEVIDEKCCAK